MENNTNPLENNTSKAVPTVAEIMSEVAQISAAGAAEVPSVDSIQTPTTTDIPEVKFVEIYSSESDTSQQAEPAQPEAAPTVEAAAPSVPVTEPSQPVQTAQQTAAPTYPQAAANTAAYPQPVQQPYNPYAPQTAQTAQTAVPTYAQAYVPVQQAANTNKRGAGKIIALILGILLTLFGLVIAIADVAVLMDTLDTVGQLGSADIVAFIIMLVPLILGILLIVVGCKKKKTAAVVNPAVQNTIPAAQNAAPVQNTMPVQNTAPVNPQNGAPTVNTMNYQYANTGLIQDESAKMVKKGARNSGLGAIGVVVLFWVLLLFLDRMFYWLLILPFILAFSSLKSSNAKSVAGWIGMIMSVLSAVFLILIFALAVAL